MPATHPPASELAAFALGKLAPDDGAGVEAHLAVCEPCQDQTAAVPPDTLVEAVAAAYTLAVGRADGATPTFAAAATPSLGAATLGWAGGVPGSDDAGVPAALVGHPKYRVVRRLGEGGMGSVWLARHEVMHRDVAVKVIRPDLLSRPGAAGRFLREVRAAARLDHPNIVRAHDAEQVGDSCLLAMEYVAGDTLAELVKDGPLPVGEACRAVRAAARGLAHAHAAGLVHRDVKPHNLMRAADGTVKVLDFGLAGVGAGEVIAAGGDGLTGAGMVVGTPDYIAPEQVADPHAADARADIYGLGCTFYHLLAGRPAVPAGSIMEKLAAHESRTPDPIPGLAADLAAVLAKMLAKRPADRYQTADEVVAALDAVTDSWRAEGASPRRRWRSALAVATGLMFALAAVFAAVVYKVLRDNEEVVISTDDPDVEVVMLRKGELVRLRDPKSGQTWELNTLTKQLGLVDQPDGLTVTLPDREPFVLRRNGREVFRVTRLPRVVPMPAAVSVGETRRFEGHTAPVFCVAYSPDGRHVLSGAGGTIVDGKPEPGEPDSTLRLWDAATGKEVRRFVGHTNHLRSAAFSSDGTRLVSGGKDGTVRVWDVSTGKELVKCDGPGGYVHAVAFAPDGKSVLAGNFDGSVRLWDSRTGTEVRRFPGATGAVTTVAYAPGGRVLTGGQDGILRVWEAETGKVIRRFDAHGNWIMALACAPDGRRVLVAVAHEDGCWMYDLDTGSRTRCLRVGAPAWVTQINWTPDGRHALTCGHEGPVRLWDVSADRQVASFVGHTQYVWGVAVSPDGRHAVSGGGDGTVRLWRLPDPPTTTKPFAVVATNAQAERPFATLAEAVAAAGSGDTVEVRGNGPFVSAPITIQGKALTIRAGAGARPVVQLSPEGEKASAPLLKTDAALVLEGLDLQFIGAGNKFRPTWPLIHSTAPLSAANCRFLMACERQALCILADGCPAVELRNCEFLMLGFNFAMTWNCPPNGKLVVDNCVHLGRTLVNVDHRDNRPASVRLAHNTVVGFGEVAV
ncbi:MAG TPA: protein kinase, partial [Urbifossiella sp.]|nr:protein kinase [Urbifossiella sp.]